MHKGILNIIVANKDFKRDVKSQEELLSNFGLFGSLI